MCESVFHLHGVKGREEGLNDFKSETSCGYGGVALHEFGDLLDGNDGWKYSEGADLAARGHDRRGEDLGAASMLVRNALQVRRMEGEVFGDGSVG